MTTITSAQLRAARALVRWRAEDLAKAARIGVATVRRAESGEARPDMTAANEAAIVSAFEAIGVEFISENGGGAGVRFRERHHAHAGAAAGDAYSTDRKA